MGNIINGSGANRFPNTSNIGFAGVDARTLNRKPRPRPVLAFLNSVVPPVKRR
jgi:hypothetical protein